MHDSLNELLLAWEGVPYAELSVMLVYLRFLATLHQTHHWTCADDPFYGDHLLFQRLYADIGPEIDLVAEKAIGVGTSDNVDLQLQMHQLMTLISQSKSQRSIPVANQLIQLSLSAEMNFLKVVDVLVNSLEQSGAMSRGIDNMIAAIQDKHEEHVYLLKQRGAR